MPGDSKSSNDGLERPAPRVPKSPGRVAQIQAQNRRREYLARNPSYFNNLEHELTDPVLYERLVKRFHSAAEREAEGKAKGYGRTLEAALQRGESKLAHMHEESNGAVRVQENGKDRSEVGFDQAWEQPPTDKVHGQQLWRDFLEDRFVHGKDDEIDYSKIDHNDEYDTLIRQDAQDAWFDEEEPSWVEDDQTIDPDKESRKLEGETGVQDF